MTVEEVKKQLKNVYYLDGRLSCLEEELATMETRLYKCTPSYSNVGGTNRSTFEYSLDRYINYRDRLNAEWDNLIQAKEEAKSLIDVLTDGTQRLVLIERYINYHTYENIAERLGYSVRQIHNIRRLAIQNIALNFTANT
jgi:DNA-directed RNA polymerase specialized sigma subunit